MPHTLSNCRKQKWQGRTGHELGQGGLGNNSRSGSDFPWSPHREADKISQTDFFVVGNYFCDVESSSSRPDFCAFHFQKSEGATSGARAREPAVCTF